MYFVNKVADLAEVEGHHPLLHIHYGKVDIELWTSEFTDLFTCKKSCLYLA